MKRLTTMLASACAALLCAVMAAVLPEAGIRHGVGVIDGAFARGVIDLPGIDLHQDGGGGTAEKDFVPDRNPGKKTGGGNLDFAC